MKGESSVPDYGMTKALSAQVPRAPIAKAPLREGVSSTQESTRAGVMAEGQMVIQIAKLEPWPAGYSDWWIGSVTLEAARDAGHSSG